MALTRGVHSALLVALAGHFHPALLTYADHPDGEVRVHSGAGTISWGGEDWTATHVRVDDTDYALVGFSGPEEEGGLATAPASVRVAATVGAMLAEMGKVVRNRRVDVWLAAVTQPAGNVLIGEPCLLFSGYFDSRVPSIRRDGDNLQHDLIYGLGVGPSARAGASITHSYEDQIAAYPGDTAGRHVQNMIKKAVNPPKWPAS